MIMIGQLNEGVPTECNGLTSTCSGYRVTMIRRETSVQQTSGQKANPPHSDPCSGPSESAPTEKSDDMRRADITNGEAPQEVVDPAVAVAERAVSSDPTPTPVRSDSDSLGNAPTEGDEGGAGFEPSTGRDDG